MTTKARSYKIPSMVMFFTSTGLTALEPIRMPVVRQYRMFVPDFSITYRKKHKTLRSAFRTTAKNYSLIPFFSILYIINIKIELKTYTLSSSLSYNEVDSKLRIEQSDNPHIY